MANESTPQTIVIPSRLEEVSRVEHAVLHQAEELGYSGADRFAIQLAMEEALANAIKHGNDNDPTKQVTIDFLVTQEFVQITITDDGPGFNPNDVPDPTLTENLDKPFGRGVMLINSYMTEVSYSPTGNAITMKKIRS